MSEDKKYVRHGSLFIVQLWLIALICSSAWFGSRADAKLRDRVIALEYRISALEAKQSPDAPKVFGGGQ